ncbi:uncharacterized protein LOC143465634 isoform X1 [Clavelina lepadiformis]|uniref:uncharacterized protein LOC143465634 isoform X1 n=1 Tax=Clavelina lepadiformis TaxID=159417 RepID=UPI00404266DB
MFIIWCSLVMKSVFYILLLLIGYGISDPADQYLICKPVNEAFESSTSESSTTNCDERATLQGKRGPQGAPGIPGPPGLTGATDYQRVKSMIEADLQDIKDELKCREGVVVDKVCYWLPKRAGVKVTYDQAAALCAYHGAVGY